MSSQEPPKGGWNWWAFIFGGLWYLVKGMWGKGLLFLLLDVICNELLEIALEAGTGPIIAVGVWVLLYRALLGRAANEHYYIHWRKRQIALGNIK